MILDSSGGLPALSASLACAVRWRTDGRGAGAEHGSMKPTVSAFTTIYTEWLDSILAMLPGASHTAPAKETTPKKEQAAANEEWEDEGGCVVPEKKPAQAPAPKIPF